MLPLSNVYQSDSKVFIERSNRDKNDDVQGKSTKEKIRIEFKVILMHENLYIANAT